MARIESLGLNITLALETPDSEAFAPQSSKTARMAGTYTAKPQALNPEP